MFARLRRRSMPLKGETKRSVNEKYGLCCCLLKIKFREIKYSHQNLSKVSKWEGFSREDFKLAHCQKSEICLEKENSDPSSDRVCHSCARKRRNAFGLHNFIYSSLQKAKQAAIEVLKQEEDIKHQTTLPCCEVQR